MPTDTFAPGIEVSFRDVAGIINFVDEHYLTICIKDKSGIMSTTCVVVYNYNWDEVKPLKSNR